APAKDPARWESRLGQNFKERSERRCAAAGRRRRRRGLRRSERRSSSASEKGGGWSSWAPGLVGFDDQYLPPGRRLINEQKRFRSLETVELCICRYARAGGDQALAPVVGIEAVQHQRHDAFELALQLGQGQLRKQLRQAELHGGRLDHLGDVFRITGREH